MNNQRRQLLIKILAATIGLYLLVGFVVEPAWDSWNSRSDRIAALDKKVKRGGDLCTREATLRDRWAGMLRANLPTDASLAENAAFKAVDRWKIASQISVTSFTPSPQWQSHDDGAETYECRLAATGSQAALSRFLYELETDSSVPVNLEECELTTRDARGSQLTLTARITFLRLKEPSKN